MERWYVLLAHLGCKLNAVAFFSRPAAAAYAARCREWGYVAYVVPERNARATRSPRVGSGHVARKSHLLERTN